MQNTDRAGLLYALAGFCTLSIGDAIIKGMAGDWPAPAMAATRYVAGTILLAVLLARYEGKAALALPRDKLHWVRGVAISLSAVGMFLGVWIMPLAEATSIFFTQPMITALLAWALLGERAKLSTWIATLVAFGGVFIVLRPNFAIAGWGALLPLLGAAGMAVTIIANRAVTGRASILAMQYYMSVTAMIFLAVVTVAGHFSGVEGFTLQWPHWSVVARCVFIGLSATLAQWLIFMGTVKAGAGTVAPMTYGQLLMAVVLGWTFFGDRPDLTSLLGASIIIGSGLYLWYAGRMKEPVKPVL
ncbi:EamA family transporter [Altererythrobacter soli]|uniref:EamA family transporter n=1 Tax=Croceibacterium soli TaxID=1739690 RepID=A0A6I4UUZ6_9SPHN|nr:DMT family transporter [Croceibacterium soli]MXP42750.1 EamA family transporter [Croceibacterium soli]